jgi:hypothetical protein
VSRLVAGAAATAAPTAAYTIFALRGLVADRGEDHDRAVPLIPRPAAAASSVVT